MAGPPGNEVGRGGGGVQLFRPPAPTFPAAPITTCTWRSEGVEITELRGGRGRAPPATAKFKTPGSRLYDAFTRTPRKYGEPISSRSPSLPSAVVEASKRPIKNDHPPNFRSNERRNRRRGAPLASPRRSPLAESVARGAGGSLDFARRACRSDRSFLAGGGGATERRRSPP